MSKSKKTYNKTILRKEVDYLRKMEMLYDAFVEHEHYCATHLDEDLYQHELVELAIRDAYDKLLDEICNGPNRPLPAVIFDRMYYMNDITTKVSH